MLGALLATLPSTKEPEPVEPLPELPLAQIPDPEVGKRYALGAPFWAIQVTAVDKWVHFQLRDGVDPQIPRRIRLRHWRSKDPVELTPAVISEMKRHNRTVSESDIDLPKVIMGMEPGSRGRAILTAILGVLP